MKYPLILFLLNFGPTLGQNYLYYTCKSYFDYTITRNLNPNCSYNADLYQSVIKIAHNYGYPAQAYTVKTEDKYLLTMFRIPHGKYRKRSNYNGIPVLLQHGAVSSSTSWVILGNQSLAFLLADQGYDVWLGNFRGSHYSLGHEYLSTGDPRYWNYTMQENGIYDVAAQIEYIYNKTGQKVIYFAYSIGTTSFYIYNMLRPDKANQQVKFAISIAPLVYLVDSQLQTKDGLPLLPWDLIMKFLESSSHGALINRTPLTLNLAMRYSLDTPLQTMLIYYIFALFTGVGFVQDEAPHLPLIIDQGIEAVVVKTVYYLIQMSINKNFTYFDYGEQGNIAFYGGKKPPLYNLADLTVPHYLIYSKGDFLASEKNALRIYQEMPEKVKVFGPPYRVPNTHFSHFDWIGSSRAYDLIYTHIIEFMNAHKNMP